MDHNSSSGTSLLKLVEPNLRRLIALIYLFKDESLLTEAELRNHLKNISTTETVMTEAELDLAFKSCSMNFKNLDIQGRVMEYAMAFDKVLKEHGWCCFFEKDAPSNSCQKQLINQRLKGIMPLQLRMHVQAETARLNIRSDKPAFYRTLLTHAQSQNLWHGSTTATNDHFES